MEAQTTNSSVSSVRRLDYALALFLSAIQALLLWPFHDCGLSYFDEGTQLRMAQLAVDLPTQITGVLPIAHGFPGFDLLYGWYFRFFDLSLLNLRREVLLVMVLNVFVFTLLCRLALTRLETAAIALAYMAWQWGFQVFAYYSREANFLFLSASLFLALWIFRKQAFYLVSAGLCVALAVACKFNVGCLGFSAAALFLFLDPQRQDTPKKWQSFLYFGLGFSICLALILSWSFWAKRPTNLLSVMWHMPVSYATNLGVPVRWPFFLLFLPIISMALALFKKPRASFTDVDRYVLFLLFSAVFLLGQDFPRHWLAHFFWSPLALWILGIFIFRRLSLRQPLKMIAGMFACIVIISYGLYTFQPWKNYFANSVALDSGRARGIFVSSREKDFLENIDKEVSLATAAGEGIFVFPVQPLLYFLFDRPNVTSYDNFHGGWRWENAALEQLKRHPPALILSVPGNGVWDLESTSQAPQIALWIEKENDFVRLISSGPWPLAIYRKR